jgi:hypothetical protein
LPLQQGGTGVDGPDFAEVEAYGLERWLGELALSGEGAGSIRLRNEILCRQRKCAGRRHVGQLADSFGNPALFCLTMVMVLRDQLDGVAGTNR